LEFAADSVNEYSLKLVPGEHILLASKETHKVNACIVDDAIEICLLEISGNLRLNDNTKYGYNHIKCNFGLLAIFNFIYQKHFWPTEETAENFKIPFVHARRKQLYSSSIMHTNLES
jgi:hypothetical protein